MYQTEAPGEKVVRSLSEWNISIDEPHILGGRSTNIEMAHFCSQTKSLYVWTIWPSVLPLYRFVNGHRHAQGIKLIYVSSEICSLSALAIYTATLDLQFIQIKFCSNLVQNSVIFSRLRPLALHEARRHSHRDRVWCFRFLKVDFGVCPKLTLQPKCRCAGRTLVGILADMGSRVFH